MHIFFLVFLQTSYGFIQIKTYKLHYFYLSPYSETTNRCEITVTTKFLSGLNLCIFPCFKYIVYQLNSFALIAKWFGAFFGQNYCVSHHNYLLSFEGTILDSKLENVGPTLSSLLCTEAYAWNMTPLL